MSESEQKKFCMAKEKYSQAWKRRHRRFSCPVTPTNTQQSGICNGDGDSMYLDFGGRVSQTPIAESTLAMTEGTLKPSPTELSSYEKTYNKRRSTVPTKIIMKHQVRLIGKPIISEPNFPLYLPRIRCSSIMNLVETPARPSAESPFDLRFVSGNFASHIDSGINSNEGELNKPPSMKNVHLPEPPVYSPSRIHSEPISSWISLRCCSFPTKGLTRAVFQRSWTSRLNRKRFFHRYLLLKVRMQ